MKSIVIATLVKLHWSLGRDALRFYCILPFVAENAVEIQLQEPRINRYWHFSLNSLVYSDKHFGTTAWDIVRFSPHIRICTDRVRFGRFITCKVWSVYHFYLTMQITNSKLRIIFVWTIAFRNKMKLCKYNHLMKIGGSTPGSFMLKVLVSNGMWHTETNLDSWNVFFHFWLLLGQRTDYKCAIWIYSTTVYLRAGSSPASSGTSSTHLIQHFKISKISEKETFFYLSFIIFVPGGVWYGLAEVFNITFVKMNGISQPRADAGKKNELC